VAFQAPTFTSGDDYATTELGNPWDMSDAADLQQTLGISDAQFGNGLFTATANGSAAGPTGGDPMMYLNLKRDGVTVPITPQRYRYLSFRLAADPAGTLNLLDRLQKGFDTRVTWWNKGLTTDGTYSKPVLNLEGWRTYSVDLSDPTFAENGPNAGGLPQWGWTRLNAVTTFRFDPIEPTMRVRFWVDDIKLCAPNAPSMLGVYRIAWQAQDPDSSLLTVTLYRGTKVGGVYREHATPIARLTQAPGNGSYLWHTAGVPNGEHYIRVRVSDGTHAVSMVSDVPVAIPGVARGNPGAVPVSGDYDGDGWADLAVYHRSTGRWFVRPLGAKAPVVFDVPWGGPGTVPVPGDYDGDGADDLAVYDTATGNWYIRRATRPALICFGQNWGGPGTMPVPGDYDGDGADDLAVYDAATGNWYIRRAARPVVICFGQNWGGPGMAPVPGDYDGDGADDLAVYDTATGNWYVRKAVRPVAICFGQNWGGPTLVPVPGDYDGDGPCDLAVFDRLTGKWYVRRLGPKTPAICFGQNWGAAGFTPVPGDYTGDAANDLCVFSDAAGTWYIRSLADPDEPPVTFGERWGW
jgi:hypothetical protein